MKEAARRRAYLREALLVLALARALTHVFSAGRVLSWANKRPRRFFHFREGEVPWITWAVDRAGARMRVEPTSLPAAIATQLMLRRRGIPSQVCLGIQADETVTSHAWVELANGRALGGIDAQKLIKLPLFGFSGGRRASVS